jgi:flagellar basal-body rod protein FlgB
MNRLNQNNFLGLPTSTTWLVNAAFVAKMRTDLMNPPLDAVPSAAVQLNPLLTIHAANSADLRASCREVLRAVAMSINDLPMLSALRTKMQWHQERQRVLSENVSNSDTPNFQPRDLIEPKFDSTGANAGSRGSLAMMRTATGHIAPSGGGQSFAQDRKANFQTRPAGNAVNLEDEMLKVSANQMDYAAVTSLYSKSLHLLKTAIGRG